MAMAMQRVHRGAQVTIGPWIDNGFYYDFDMSNAEPFTEKVLKKVKKELRRIIRKDLPFVREVPMRPEPELKALGSHTSSKFWNPYLKSAIPPEHRLTRAQPLSASLCTAL